MRKFDFAHPAAIVLPVLAALASASPTAAAHEGHKTECSETALNTITADIQSMSDGDSKTTAIKEIEMAEEMKAKNDLKACVTHVHNAREAIEK